MLGLKVCLLVLITLPTIQSSLSLYRRLHEQRRRLFLERVNRTYDEKDDKYFGQKLDHFDKKNVKTWKQRYWENAKYENGSNLHFLYIGGEEKESKVAVDSSSITIVDMASKFGAKLWLLEHRFYGKSRPTQNMSIENLKYLTSRQAIGDLANFIRSKNKEIKLKSPKWIVFGGSYAGSLALWFRKLYPDLAIGAVGSSAPMKLVVDFYGYFRVCEDVYRNQSSECADGIRDAFRELDDLMDSDKGRQKLDTIFKFDPPIALQKNISDLSLGRIYSNLRDRFATQYFNPERIKSYCDTMTDLSKDPLIRLRELAPETINYNYEDEVKDLSNVEFNENNFNYRAWTYQTCVEMGFFQTTDYNGIFGYYLPVSLDYDLCVDVYGNDKDVDYIQKAIQDSLEYYGRAEVTNVVIINGQLDPWGALGIHKSKNPSMVTFLIRNASHCDDMSTPDETSSSDRKEAYKLTFENIKLWISQDASPSASSSQDFETEKARIAPYYNAKICWNCKMPKYQIAIDDESDNFDILNGPEMTSSDLKSNLTKNWIEQPLDHFNQSEKRTFKQLFYLNDKYYKKGGPIFLYLGPARPIIPEAIDGLYKPIIDFAKRYSGMLFLLEHRYYGSSSPVDIKGLKNLKWLTSEQALADAATFIRNINRDKKLNNPKWISYGGSYSASLAAWLRQTYPDDTFASVGSSGPFEAVVDFYKFTKNFEDVLKGQKEGCLEGLAESMDVIHGLLTTVEGREKINKVLKRLPHFKGESIDPFQIMEFYRFVGIFIQMVQRNDKHNPLKELCERFSNKKIDPLERVALYMAYDNSGPRSLVSKRWAYQTCNEYGWYPTSNIGYNALGNVLPINYYLHICEHYGKEFTRDKIEENVERTNKRYGGSRNFRSSRVIQVYGSLDGWKTVGLFASNGSHGEDVVTILINGTSHCADIYGPDKILTNPEGVRKALEEITGYLDKWLK